MEDRHAGGGTTFGWFLVLAVACVLFPAVSGARGSGHAASVRAAAEPVTLVVRIDARGRGTFTTRGTIADQGRALVRRSVVNGRLNATETLTGAKGTIVLTLQHLCGRNAGTWRVVSGTLAYEKGTGRGATIGVARCARPLGSAVIVHRGAVELPPPPLARPGSWGGRTAQAGVITFTVTPDGRSVTGVLATRYRYECVRSDGQRSVLFSATQNRFAGPFAIGEDRMFSIKTFDGTIAGRFGASGAEGTITVSRTMTSPGQTTTCSASIPWTATNPPGPLPRALAGVYCGIAAAGGGVCVDVPAEGREARNFRAEIKLTCGILARIPLSTSVAYPQSMAFGLDLSFRQSFDHQVEGKTVSVTVAGTFDENGGLTGSVGVSSFTIERDGASHLCRSAGSFTATLQR
jgi:hypothetical protein